MATDFGKSIAGPTDIPSQFYYATGIKNLGNHIARRLITPRGSMSWALNDGYDVRQLVNAEFTPNARARAEAAISAEVEKDDRVEACAAAITRLSPEAIAVTLRVTTADGTFPLVVSVNSLTVALLG
jgi:hypothetical protein